MFRLFVGCWLCFLLASTPAQEVFAQARLVDEVLLKPSTVHDVAVLPDGGFVIASDTTHVGSNAVDSRMLRFNAQLERVQGWGPAIESALAVAFDADGQWLYVGGGFTSIEGLDRPRLARLSLGGQLDVWALSPGNGQSSPGAIENLAVLPNGDLLAVHRPGTNSTRELLLIDTTSGAYQVLHRLSDAVFDIQILDDGRVLVGGAFEFVNGSLRRGLIRLNAGTLTVDTAFAARPIVGGRWSSYHVRAIALDSTGAVFVSASDQVHRLREDGTTEYSFFSWANINVEQIAFDAQDRPYVLTGWPSSLGPNVAPSLSGLVRFDDPASNSVAPGFASPQIAGRGARMILSGERLILLGSMRSSQTGAIGALALSAESGAPAASLAALGTTENVALYGAIPIGSGGTLVFGEFTHAVSGSRLWGTLRLNAQGQRIDGPFMDFFGTPDAFSLTPDGNLLYTSLSRPMPRPQDWGEQFPEGEWIVGGVRVNDGARLPWDTYSNINLDTQFKSGIVSHDDGPLLARRNSLRSGTGFAGQNSTSTGLPFGTTRRIAVDASGFAVLDRGPPPPNAFSSVGGVGFWPPPSSSPPVRMLYRWLPGPGSAIGLGPDRSAPLAEVGGFDVHRASGVIYASFPGQTTAQPPWSIRRIDPAGAPEGEVLSTLADHWAPGGLALDEQAQYAYLGGFGPLDSSGNRPARVFRVATTDGEVDPEWPRRGGDAVQAKWIYMVGDQVFALSATASGTYAAFYRTDGVLFEDGFEQ